MRMSIDPVRSGCLRHQGPMERDAPLPRLAADVERRTRPARSVAARHRDQDIAHGLARVALERSVQARDHRLVAQLHSRRALWSVTAAKGPAAAALAALLHDAAEYVDRRPDRPLRPPSDRLRSARKVAHRAIASGSDSARAGRRRCRADQRAASCPPISRRTAGRLHHARRAGLRDAKGVCTARLDAAAGTEARRISNAFKRSRFRARTFR